MVLRMELVTDFFKVMYWTVSFGLNVNSLS